MRSAIWGICLGWLLILPSEIAAQLMLKQPVSAAYSQATIGFVLEDLEDRYGIVFSYSQNQIPLEQTVDVDPMNGTLANLLDAVFEQTKVVYTLIGKQIVLKYSPEKPIPARKQREQKPDPEEGMETPVEESMGVGDQIDDSWPEGIVQVPTQEEPPENPADEPYPEAPFEATYTMDDFSWRFLDSMNVGKTDHQNVAQLSFFPGISTSEKELLTTAHHHSVNLVGGINGGVEGWELGVLVNVNGGGMQGIQLAGAANVVSAEVQGLQLAGLFNVVNARVEGTQLAGLFNVGRGGSGWQLSTLFNVSDGAFDGVQLGGLFNVAGNSHASYQLSGLFNVQSRGETMVQIAPVFNQTGSLRRLQLGLINIAGESDGVQVGLINISKGAESRVIGLLNFVRKGYNRMEIAGGDALYGNIGLKMGSRPFYNILQVGMRVDTRPLVKDGQRQEDEFLTWGLGYGIGTLLTLNSRLGLNIEGVGLHINEAEGWTDDLNLLNQLRLTLDVSLGKRFSLFGGGTFNVMVSRLEDPETGMVGSRIAPYAWSDHTTEDGTNTQVWAGFNAGIRF